MNNTDFFLFVCHVSEDRAAALEIVSELERRGVRCWLAPRNVRPGRSFDDEIADAIDACWAMLLIFSDRCNDSDYIRREVTVAGESQKLIIPFRIEDAKPRRGLKVRLSDLHWIDGFVSPELAIDELARNIPSDAKEQHGKIASKTPLSQKDDDHRLGSTSVQARDAGIQKKPINERTFPIELPGVVGWPKPVMVAIPPGRFIMGGPQNEVGAVDSERPQHAVTIDYTFALGKCPVTFAEWDAAIGDAKLETPDDGQWGRDGRPVINVSWNDAKTYLHWLNEKLGLLDCADPYRLPSEAEWEYACRAETITPFSFGETISTAEANYDGNHTYGPGRKGEYRQGTTVVGSFPANHFGLHDMHGNVWEWCEDAWASNYDAAPPNAVPRLGGDRSYRVLRGGCWWNGPRYLRSAGRFGIHPDDRSTYFGFRICRTL